MEDDHNNGDAAETNVPEAEVDATEFASLVASGPNGGNRAGGLNLLALLLIVAGVLYYHFSTSGSNAFINRLDSDLLAHAELTLASAEENARLAIVPSWPLRLYAVLRRDIAIYAALAAGAAWLWGHAVRARAKRDAYLVHQNQQREIAALRERLDRIDPDGAAVQPKTTTTHMTPAANPAGADKGKE